MTTHAPNTEHITVQTRPFMTQHGHIGIRTGHVGIQDAPLHASNGNPGIRSARSIPAHPASVSLHTACQTPQDVRQHRRSCSCNPQQTADLQQQMLTAAARGGNFIQLEDPERPRKPRPVDYQQMVGSLQGGSHANVSDKSKYQTQEPAEVMHHEITRLASEDPPGLDHLQSTIAEIFIRPASKRSSWSAKTFHDHL